jgi:gluconokinase
MSKTSRILSLDIGTSSTRALLYDEFGNAVEDAEVQIHYDQKTTPDGGVETDADGLCERTIDAIRSLLDKPGLKSGEIAGVAVSCFWHSLMGVDESGAATTPLYSWADTRSRGEVATLASKLDAEAYHARTGCFLHPSYWPAKLLWLEKTHGDEFHKAKRWVSFAEYLSLQLFGNACCSISMASATGLFDQNKRTWDKETLDALPISEENLLPLTDLGESQSGMPKPPAGLEILRDVPWFPALGDGATSNLGAGGASEQRMVINLGTSGAIRVMAERNHIDIPPGLFCYRADSHRFLVGGAVSNGGNVYAWLSRNLKLGDDSPEMERQVAQAEPDGHGLTVLPFWAGERSPGWHVDARAAILGLNLHTSPVDIFQASLEAVAYTFADIRAELQPIFPHAQEIIVSGGALEHSPAWAQIFADVLGSPVQISLTSEPSGRGAALFVSAALGLIDSLGEAPDLLGKTYYPNPTRQAVYKQAQDRYRSYYDRLIAGSE